MQNLGNFSDGMNVPRFARPADFACKYLFHRNSRRPRGRGYTSKATCIQIINNTTTKANTHK